jgi:hypothetical protein
MVDCLAVILFKSILDFPLTLVLAGFLSLGTGFWASFGAAVSADMKVTVFWGFLLYLHGGYAFALMFLVCARFIATICFYPMSQSWKDVT